MSALNLQGEFFTNIEQFIQAKIQEEVQKQKEILETEYQEKAKELEKKYQKRITNLISEQIRLKDYNTNIWKEHNKLNKFVDKLIDTGIRLEARHQQALDTIKDFPKKDIFIEDFIKGYDIYGTPNGFFKKNGKLSKNKFLIILRNEQLIKIQKNLRNKPTQKALDLEVLVEKISTFNNYRLAITSKGRDYFKELLETKYNCERLFPFTDPDYQIYSYSFSNVVAQDPRKDLFLEDPRDEIDKNLDEMADDLLKD